MKEEPITNHLISALRVVTRTPRNIAQLHSSWAKYRQVKKMTRSSKKGIPPGEMCVGFYKEKIGVVNRFLNLNRKTITKHVLVLAVNGSGQLNSIYLPNCYHSNKTSFIAYDPNFELWDRTSERQSRPILFDLFQPHESAKFNFVASARDLNIAKLIAASIINHKSSDSEQYVSDDKAIQLLTALNYHVAHSNNPTPTQLYSLVCAGEDVIIQVLSESTLEASLNECTSFIDLPKEVRYEMVKYIKIKLDWLQDPNIIQFTNTNEPFDFHTLRAIPTQIYWAIPDDLHQWTQLTNIFFNLAVAELLKSEPQKVPVTLFINKFPSIGQLIKFEENISKMSDRDIALVAAIQSIGELEYLYGMGATETILKNFETKIVFGNLEPKIAKNISLMIARHDSDMETSAKTQTPSLITSAEIRRLPHKKLILISKDCSFITIDRLDFGDENFLIQ